MVNFSIRHLVCLELNLPRNYVKPIQSLEESEDERDIYPYGGRMVVVVRVGRKRTRQSKMMKKIKVSLVLRFFLIPETVELQIHLDFL